MRLMTIQIKFFASLRETLGRDDTTLSSKGPLSIRDTWNQATDHTDYPVNTLCAINMNYAQLDYMVVDGDEVAFFPPVTGG